MEAKALPHSIRSAPGPGRFFCFPRSGGATPNIYIMSRKTPNGRIRLQTPQQPVRISVTGPESTGKSELSQWLARELGLGWVPEVARTYLPELGRPYRKEDLRDLLNEQLALEAETLRYFPQGLVADTDSARAGGLERMQIRKG